MEKLHDRDIREGLFDFLDETFGKIRIIEEKTMGKSRADLVMVTSDSLVGVEIKSDADTYVRLTSQVKDYDKYYDYNYIVIGSSHAAHIEEHVPPYWGIITVELEEKGLDFYILRHPLSNPKMKWKKKLEIMWRPELALLQEWNGMPRYKEKSKDFVKNKILERLENGKIEEALLREQISNILYERDYSDVKAYLRSFFEKEEQRRKEKENDPAQRELLQKQRALAKANFGNRVRYRRRRRKKA